MQDLKRNIQTTFSGTQPLRTTILVVCLLFPVLCATAQDTREMARKDLIHMEGLFAGAQSWVLESEARMFDAPAGGNLLETAGSRIVQSGRLRHEKHEQSEFLASKDHFVVVDHLWKTISVAQRQAERATPSSTVPTGEAMLKGCERVDALPVADGMQGYLFHYSRGDFETVEMRLDARTRICRSLTYHFRDPISVEDGGSGQKPRMEVIFSTIDFAPSLKADQFAVEHYCRVNGNTVQPATRFSDYQIVH